MVHSNSRKGEDCETMNQVYDQSQSINIYRITVQGNSEGLFICSQRDACCLSRAFCRKRVWGRVRCARRIRRAREEVDFNIRNRDGLLRVSGKVGRRSWLVGNDPRSVMDSGFHISLIQKSRKGNLSKKWGKVYVYGVIYVSVASKRVLFCLGSSNHGETIVARLSWKEGGAGFTLDKEQRQW